MKRFEDNSLTKKILLEFGRKSKNLLDVSAKIIFDPHGLVKEAGVSLYNDDSQGSFSRKINYLKKSKYFKEKDDEFYLTQEGRAEIIQELIREDYTEQDWDGKWRGFIFDIPESRRRDRDFLRRELRWMHFVKLQESIWVFPYDVEQEFRTLLKLWKKDFKGDVRFIVMENITPDKDIKSRFDL